MTIDEMNASGTAIVRSLVETETPVHGAGRVVTGKFSRTASKLVSVSLQNGDVIASTPQHPFFSSDRGAYIAASELRTGEKLRTRTGETVRVATVVEKAESAPVHNIEVAVDHNYFVGPTPVLVHNVCELDWGTDMWPPDPAPPVPGEDVLRRLRRLRQRNPVELLATAPNLHDGSAYEVLLTGHLDGLGNRWWFTHDRTNPELLEEFLYWLRRGRVRPPRGPVTRRVVLLWGVDGRPRNGELAEMGMQRRELTVRLLRDSIQRADARLLREGRASGETVLRLHDLYHFGPGRPDGARGEETVCSWCYSGGNRGFARRFYRRPRP